VERLRDQRGQHAVNWGSTGDSKAALADVPAAEASYAFEHI